MSRYEPDETQASRKRWWSAFLIGALIPVIGFNLRTVTLTIPPLLPLIQHDLALTYTEVGLLIALPMIIFAGTAWLSGMLIERIGGPASVTLGLVVLGVGTLLRGLLPGTLSLFFCTILLSGGIGLLQTALPALIRVWFPRHIGLVNALLSDGMIVGEAVAAGLTVPLLYWLLGPQNWRGSLLFWTVPAFVTLFLWLWLQWRSIANLPSVSHLKTEALTRPRSDWRSSMLVIHIGLVVGTGSLIYFGMNNWIASYNQALHQEALTPLALAVLNAAQLPISLLVTFFAQRLAGRRMPFVLSGIVSTIAVIGWVFAPASLQLLWVILLGGCAGINFTLGIILPSLYGRPEQIARLTGMVLTIGYSLAFAGSFVGGWLWDLFHQPAVAFLPVLFGSILLIVTGGLLPPLDVVKLSHEEQSKDDLPISPMQG